MVYEFGIKEVYIDEFKKKFLEHPSLKHEKITIGEIGKYEIRKVFIDCDPEEAFSVGFLCGHLAMDIVTRIKFNLSSDIWNEKLKDF